MKHNVYMCEECLQCRDPELFCKHRPSCPIWFLTRKTKGLDNEPPSAAKSAAADR